MRRLLLILVVAALLLAGAFAYLAPASLLATQVERATGGTIKARQVEGTVWRGRGVLAAEDSQLPIAWTVDPAPLLHGELRARIGAFDGNGPTPRADVVARRESVSLRDVDITLPLPLVVDALGGRIARRVGVVAAGDLAIRSTRLDWVPPAVNGDVVIIWRGARLTVPTQAPIELGEVTATLAADGTRLTGPVRNSGGAIDILGDVTARADDATLAKALAAIGSAEGSGWRVNWQTPPR